MIEIKKTQVYQIIFFIVSIILILFTTNDITKQVGTLVPQLKIVSTQTQTIKISDDIYVNLQYNGTFEEFYGSMISKDNEKIILLDSDNEENRMYFDYNITDIKKSSDILPIMLNKTGYLLNNQLNEDMQVEELVIFNEKSVVANELSMHKYIGYFKTNNNQNLNFICYSFIKNEKPCYMLVADLSETQELDLSKYLIGEI